MGISPFPEEISLTSKSAVNTIVYQDFQSARFLEKDWDHLLSESTFPNIFLTWEWITTWWKWFGSGKNLRLFVAYDDSRIQGILPMYIRQVSLFPGFRVPAIYFIGDGGPVCPEYLGPVFRESDADRIIDALAKSFLGTSGQWKMVCLSDILVDQFTIRLFLNRLSQNFNMETEEGERCPYQLLPPDYETFLCGLSPKRKKRVAYELRRAKKEYNVRMDCHTSPDSVEDAFSILLEIYKKSARGQQLGVGFTQPDYFGFHCDVAESLARQKWLRLYILWFNDIPVAFIYGYLYGGVFWFYQTAYHSAYEKMSPGAIVLQLTIESAIGEGAREFDFLRGDEDYKFHFASQERRTKTVKGFHRHSWIQMIEVARSNLLNIIHKIKK